MEKAKPSCCGVCATYLCEQLQSLLEVVVLHSDHILTSEYRQSEIETILDLLDEVVPLAIPAWQRHIQMLSKQPRLALSQTLLFARQLDGIQEHASRTLEPKSVALLAWAWIRRTVLGLTSTQLLQWIPLDWRTHEGLSPLQRTRSTLPGRNWLAALGYSALTA